MPNRRLKRARAQIQRLKHLLMVQGQLLKQYQTQNNQPAPQSQLKQALSLKLGNKMPSQPFDAADLIFEGFTPSSQSDVKSLFYYYLQALMQDHGSVYTEYSTKKLDGRPGFIDTFLLDDQGKKQVIIEYKYEINHGEWVALDQAYQYIGNPDCYYQTDYVGICYYKGKWMVAALCNNEDFWKSLFQKFKNVPTYENCLQYAKR